MEPATTAGIDPKWEADHPYLLGGKIWPDGSYSAPPHSFFFDTGMVVPELDPPGFNTSRCTDDDCTPHTVGPDGRTVRDSHLVLFQKHRATTMNTTPVDSLNFKYTTTGALDLRSSAAANAKFYDKLSRLSFRKGRRDGTTINLGFKSGNSSFNSLYEKTQRDFPGILPAWSPHSPFINPYEARDGILSGGAPYRAGRPFYRYSLKRCPGSGGDASKCCLSLESSMKMSVTDCTDDNSPTEFCGRNNPVASLVRPGNLPVELYTPDAAGDDNIIPADYRVSLKVAGVATAFSRAVPDLATANFNDGDLPGQAVDMLNSIKSQINTGTDRPDNVPNKSPKCQYITAQGAGTRIATMFLEHYYVALGGSFETIKRAQIKKQRPWREGKTEYVRPTENPPAEGPVTPDKVKHVLDTTADTKDDQPTSERLAFVFGPSIKSANTDRESVFNDHDTPCSQMGSASFTRDIGESEEKVGMSAGETEPVLRETRCMCRRAGKFEWLIQAMVATHRAINEGTVFRPSAEPGWVCRLASEAFQSVAEYGKLINQQNRVIFWDIDHVFDMAEYKTAYADHDHPNRTKYSEIVRLHTTAPIKGAEPVAYTQFKNLRAGIPGADEVVPTITASECAKLEAYIAANPSESVCDVCKLAGNWQISQTFNKLQSGTCSGSANTAATGENRYFAYLPHCCSDGHVLEVTSDLIWTALKKIGKDGFNYDIDRGEAVVSGTGARWFRDNEGTGPFSGGSSDGTPRTNVYSAICHVEPLADTVYLMKSLSGFNIDYDNKDANGNEIQYGKVDAMQGLNTLTAGTLWPGDSFRQRSAEPYQSLGAPSDNMIPTPIERWDFNLGADPWMLESNGEPIKTTLYGADGATDRGSSEQSHQGVHSCADQANRTFFTPFDFGSRGALLGDVRNAECSCCSFNHKPSMPFFGRVTTDGIEEWDMRWTFSRGSNRPISDTVCNDARSCKNKDCAPHKSNFVKPNIPEMSRTTSDGRGNNPAGCPGGQGVYPGFMADFFNNVRYNDDTMFGATSPTDFASGINRADTSSFYNITGCCQVRELGGLCKCLPTETNSAGEPCTTVKIPQSNDYYQNLLVNATEEFATYLKGDQGIKNDLILPPFGGPSGYGAISSAVGPVIVTTTSRCFTFRREWGDGSIVVGARAARGGAAPATPSATLGGVRLPPVQYLFNAETCPRWDKCPDGNGGRKQCVATDTAQDRMTYGRLGAQEVGHSPPGAAGEWGTLNPNLLSTGTLADEPKRCFNALEHLGKVVGPLCTRMGKYYPADACDKDGNIPAAVQETAAQQNNGNRMEYKLPFIHPSKQGSEIDTDTHCPTKPGPTVRGLDSMTLLFEHDEVDTQEAVGRINWGKRKFDDSLFENPDFVLPKAQYSFTDTAPYSNGKNDGILECASTDQDALRIELLRHSILKTTDICTDPKDGVPMGDDGISLTTDRTAPFRDAYSTCVNVADAAIRFCSALIISNTREHLDENADDPVGTCMLLFGNGRALNVRPENRSQFAEEGIVLTLDRPDGRTTFPKSCYCTGGDSLQFPIRVGEGQEGYDAERLSWISSLCACGAVARTARVVLGSVGTDANPDFERPPFLEHDAPKKTAYCECEDEGCVPRRSCPADKIALDQFFNKMTEDFIYQVDITQFKAGQKYQDYQDTLNLEMLPTNYLVRNRATFTKTDTDEVQPAMDFTAVEKAQLTECLTTGVDCDAGQTSFGDAILTYPLSENDGQYTRAVILPPLCASLAGGTDSLAGELVTSNGAPFSELAPLFYTDLVLLKVSTQTQVKPGLRYKNDDNPVSAFLVDTLGYRTTEDTDDAGCLLATASENEDLSFFTQTLGFGGAGLKVEDSQMISPMNHYAVSVAESFVFGDDGDAVRRFSRLLRDCIGIIALVHAGQVAGRDTVTSAVRSSLCYTSVATENAALARTGDAISFLVAAPPWTLTMDANIAAVGTCLTATGTTRMFAAAAQVGARLNTVTLPNACDSEIKYSLVDVAPGYLDRIREADGRPVTFRGTMDPVRQPASTSLCYGNRRFFPENTPFPFVAPAPAPGETDDFFSAGGDFLFAAKSRQFPDIADGGATEYREPTEARPCWVDVCADHVQGKTSVVFSGAGRLPQTERVFEPLDPDAFLSSCAPELADETDSLSGGNCALYELADSATLAVCQNFRATLAGGRSLADWSFPANPPGLALVDTAPFIATCHDNGGRLDFGRSRTGTSITTADGTELLPSAAVYSTACGLHIRPTVFESPAIVGPDPSTRPSVLFITAVGLIDSPVVALPDDATSDLASVVPLAAIARPPLAPPSRDVEPWYVVGITAEANRPPAAGAPFDACSQFIRPPESGNVPATASLVDPWKACAGLLAPVATVIPAEFWGSPEGAVVLDPEGTPRFHVDLTNPTVPSVCASQNPSDSVFLLNAWPAETKDNAGRIGQLTVSGGSAACISECVTTLACVSLHYSDSGRCTLFDGSIRTVAFSAYTPVQVVHASAPDEIPAGESLFAFCVGSASPFDVRRALFERPATLFAATVPDGEPCPDAGTAAAVDSAGRRVCVWTPCDVDAPSPTQYADADGALARVHGHCSPAAVEATTEQTLESIAHIDETATTSLWEPGATPIATPIGVEMHATLQLKYRAPYSRPGTAGSSTSPADAASPSIVAVVELPDISAAAYAKNRCTCQVTGGCSEPEEPTPVPSPPPELYPGQDILGGTFVETAPGCNCADGEIAV
jgi:hypothetical protein